MVTTEPVGMPRSGEREILEGLLPGQTVTMSEKSKIRGIVGNAHVWTKKRYRVSKTAAGLAVTRIK